MKTTFKKFSVKALCALCMAAIVMLSLALAGCGGNSESANASNSNTVVIDVKDYGTITVELDPESAPITVENFKKLVSEGFYDGLTFHRIISGFMIQGGFLISVHVHLCIHLWMVRHILL